MNKKLFFVLLCVLYFVTGFFANAQMIGDVDGNGDINIVDALCIAQYYVGLTPTNFNSAYADVDGDGGIDIVDALLVAQCYVGLILCDFGGTGGNGLKGEYYSDMNFGTLALTRIDSTVNFDWVQGSPDTSIPNDYFSIRWTGEIEPEYSDTYTFYESTDDGCRLWVDNQQIIDVWTSEEAIEYTGTINLVAGQKVPIVIEFYEEEGEASASLSWSCSSQSKEIVPQDRLYSEMGPTPTAGPATPTPTPGTTSTFHVFLLLGQSNMAGYPDPQAADKVENSRILVLGYDECSATGRHTDQWDVACPPLHECWNGLGPGDWFAKTLIDYLPEGDTIGLVPCAISGEKIETFMKSGGSKYNWIIQRAQLAQQEGGVIEGILFHQGESNNGDSNWPGNVNTLVTDIRTDLGIGNVPFIAGELLYSGSCSGHNTLVNQLPGVVSNCYVVSADGLVVDPADTEWGLHFGHDSQVTLGKRYAQKMIQALGL